MKEIGSLFQINIDLNDEPITLMEKGLRVLFTSGSPSPSSQLAATIIASVDAERGSSILLYLSLLFLALVSPFCDGSLSLGVS